MAPVVYIPSLVTTLTMSAGCLELFIKVREPSATCTTINDMLNRSVSKIARREKRNVPDQ